MASLKKLASYLGYSLGRRVLVLDTDGPEYSLFRTRERELAYAKEHGSADESSLYPVWQIKDPSPNGIDMLTAKLFLLQESFDYVLVDFPGSCMKEDAVWGFADRGLLSLVVIPVDMDSMALASAMQLSEIFRGKGQKVLLFFNRVHGKIAREKYDAVETVFAERGHRFSPHRVKNALAMQREADTSLQFLRSSICFPEKNIRELNPEIIGLFEEIVALEEKDDGPFGDST